MGVLLLLIGAATALACGQTTHVWTTLHAVDHLPAGPLKAALSDPAVHGALVSGAMFPDGGYIPGDPHPYGEASHWEPFQDHVLAGLIGRSDRPDPDPLLAFTMGMAAHGIADQTYDAAYLFRAGEHDGVGQSSDTSTDIHYAAIAGALEPNAHWVPYPELVGWFAEEGIEVDEARMESGMDALDLAVAVVGFASTSEDALAEHAAIAPWATSHLDDPAVPGAPGCLGEAIADYWLGLEARLDGGRAPWVVHSYPAEGGYRWPREGVDATLSVVFGRALDAGSLPGRVTLEGPDGDVPIAYRMYYGDASNVLDVEVLEPLAEDAEHVLVIAPGLVDLDGRVLDETVRIAFSTGAPPVPVSPDPWTTGRGGCGCTAEGAGVPSPWGWLDVLVRRRDR